MTTPIYQEAFDVYVNPLHEFIVEPITGGLINQSFKVTSKLTSGSFMLQRINEFVFPEPEKVQYNYELLWDYLYEEDIDFILPKPKYFPDDSTIYCDSQLHYWRVFEFMEGTKTMYTAPDATVAGAVAETFATFTVSFNNFDAEELEIVIPDFHNLSLRYKQFKNSVKTGNRDRIQKAQLLIEELKSRERYASLYDVITESDDFVQRVMHHDAKISNVLFDVDSGKVVCPVDFDTAMPGYFFSDLGDMIRSMAASHDETSTEFKKIRIRKNFYKAIIDGYIGILEDYLTEPEKKHIHHSGIFMIYMQALRFLTDYLNEDAYYRISYPEQNYDRAKNQFILLQQLEKFLEANYNLSLL